MFLANMAGRFPGARVALLPCRVGRAGPLRSSPLFPLDAPSTKVTNCQGGKACQVSGPHGDIDDLLPGGLGGQPPWQVDSPGVIVASTTLESWRPIRQVARRLPVYRHLGHASGKVPSASRQQVASTPSLASDMAAPGAWGSLADWHLLSMSPRFPGDNKPCAQ